MGRPSSRVPGGDADAHLARILMPHCVRFVVAATSAKRSPPWRVTPEELGRILSIEAHDDESRQAVWKRLQKLCERIERYPPPEFVIRSERAPYALIIEPATAPPSRGATAPSPEVTAA